MAQLFTKDIFYPLQVIVYPCVNARQPRSGAANARTYNTYCHVLSVFLYDQGTSAVTLKELNAFFVYKTINVIIFRNYLASVFSSSFESRAHRIFPN